MQKNAKLLIMHIINSENHWRLADYIKAEYPNIHRHITEMEVYSAYNWLIRHIGFESDEIVRRDDLPVIVLGYMRDNRDSIHDIDLNDGEDTDGKTNEV